MSDAITNPAMTLLTEIINNYPHRNPGCNNIEVFVTKMRDIYLPAYYGMVVPSPPPAFEHIVEIVPAILPEPEVVAVEVVETPAGEHAAEDLLFISPRPTVNPAVFQEVYSDGVGPTHLQDGEDADALHRDA